MIRQFLNPPNWFTSANLFCGFYAISILIRDGGEPHSVFWAGLLLLFAAVFDMLDGRVARMTGSGSAFGTQLDSLADVVSFGVAPALLMWTWSLQHMGAVGMALAFAFVICGTFRLARFNLDATGEADPESTGLTITVAGVTMALLVTSSARPESAGLAPWSAALATISLALLMVSKVQYRTFKAIRISPRLLASLALMAGIGVTVGARFDLTTGFLVLAMFYVASGPAEAMVRLALRRRTAGVAPDDIEDLSIILEDSPDDQA